MAAPTLVSRETPFVPIRADRRSARTWASAGAYLALAAGGVFVVFPFAWMVATALKGPREIFELHFWP